MKKRIISMMLVLVMSFTLIGQMTIRVEATPSSVADYTYIDAASKGEDFFKAWYYACAYDGGREVSLRNRFESLLYRQFYKINNQDVIGNTARGIWLAMDTDFELTEEDLYITLLLNMMNGEYGEISGVENGVTMGDGLQFAENLHSILLAIAKQQEYSTVNDLLKYGKLTNLDENTIKESVGSICKIDEWDKIGNVLTLIRIAYDATKDLGETLSRIGQVFSLIGSDWTKYRAVLEELSKYRGNDTFSQIRAGYIRKAASDILGYMNSDDFMSYIWTIADQICNGLYQGSRHALATLLKSKMCEVPAFATVQVAMKVVDIFLSVSGEAAQVFTILALNEMGDALFEATSDLRSVFINQSLDDAAGSYLASLDLYLRYGLSTCSYVDKYLHELYKSGLLKSLIRDDNAYNQYKETLQSQYEYLNKELTRFETECSELYNRSRKLYLDGFNITYESLETCTNLPNPQHKLYDEDIIITSQKPLRDGYSFFGWTTLSGTTRVDYKPGDIYRINEGNTLYAVWTAKKDTITYNLNGGTNAPASEENKEGPSTLSSVEPRRTGYIFKGWARTSDATKAEFYKPNNMVLEDDGDITLYAVWELGTFPVYFDANGGQYSDGSTSVMRTKTYNVPLTMDIPQPIRGAGYEFLGWSENPKSTTPDEKFNAPQVGSIGGNNLNEKHVYAVWCKNTATITYDYGIGRFDPYTTTVKEPLSKGTGQHLIGNPLAHNKSGEDTLLNWYYYKGSEKVYCNIDETVAINGDLYLYANWQSPRPQPTISVKSDKTVYKPGESVKLSISIDKSDHFYIDVTGLPGAVVDGGSALFVERTSPAAAGHRNYDNGTTVTEYIDIPSNCSDGLYDIEIRASNSVLDSEGTGNVDNERPIIETVRIKVQRNEIVEEKDVYTVSFDLNGGAGSAPEPLRGEDGSSVYLPDCKKTSGFEFAGWCAKANGKGAKYDAGERYTISDNITLYAIWESKAGPLDVHVEKSTKIYEPGDVAYIDVAPDYADHFYFDISGNPGFTIKSKDGDIYTNGASFWNVDSEDYIPGETGFADNKSVMMYVYIPDNCRDGDYTFKVTATSARWDPVTHQVPEGSPMVTKYTAIHVRSTDNADSVELSRDHVTVHVGSRKTIKATIYPDIYNKTKAVYWSTGNRRIASIYDEGDLWVEIEGERVGTTYITGEVDNASATCEIEVVECDYCNKEIDPDYLASAATCTERAKYYYVCDCGNISDETYEYGSLADHKFTDWTVTAEPDEYTVGMKTRKCINCDKVESKEIPALEHTHDLYDQWFYNDTHHWHECRSEKCYEKLDMSEHVFTDENDLICDCGYEREPVHTHDFESGWKSDADYHWHECECGEISDKEAHMWDDGVVTTEPTETTEGVKTFTCATCGKTRTESIPKKDHEHKYGNEWLKNEANHWHECKCGDMTDVEAHTINWTVEKEATEEAEGLEKGICSICGYETTRAIPKKDHVHEYGNEWLNDETNHWHECECGDKSGVAEHILKEVIDTAPTEDSDGVAHDECEVCGLVTNEGKVIPALEHTHTMAKVEAKAATCIEEGNIEYYTCTKCYKNFVDEFGENEVENVAVDKDPFNHIGGTRVDGKLDPDCSNAGYTGDTVCVSCGVILINGDVIPTNDNHNYEWKVDVEPTVEEPGLKHEECTRCGAKRSENTEIPRIECAHSTMQHYEKISATCTMQGTCEYWHCSECNRKYFDEKGMLLVNSDDELLIPVDPSNHLHTELRGVKSSTCSSNGYSGDTYCIDCSALVSSGTVVEVNPSAHRYMNNVCEYCGKVEYYVPSYMFVDDEYHLSGGVLAYHLPDSLILHTDGVYEWQYCIYCNHEYGKVFVTEDDESVELIVDDPVESGDVESIPDEPVTEPDASEPVQDNNPRTGIVIALLPMALAMAAAIATKKAKK